METADNLRQIAGTSKRLLGRVLTIVENRLELLMIEVQEERERILRVILLALGAAVFGLLAGVALTIAAVLFFWDRSPLTVALVLAGVFSGCGGLLYLNLTKLQRDWQTLPGTVEQLRKDRECLERSLT